MKRSKFSEAQIAFVLKQADDGTLVGEVWRRDYNKVRLHSAIGNKPPISLRSASVAHGPP